MELPLIEYLEQSVWWLAAALAPLLLVVAVAGFCVSFLLAIIQVQEAALTLCGRLLAVSLALYLGGAGAIQSLIQFFCLCLEAQV